MNQSSYGETSGFTPVPGADLETVAGGCLGYPYSPLRDLLAATRSLTKSK
jgi:hypothetical protein